MKPSASLDALYIAGEMANAHNGLIRSLNSMYLQAPYVTEDADIQDLLQFAIFWESWIEKHHLGEEKLFFPDVVRITGQKDIPNKLEYKTVSVGIHALINVHEYHCIAIRMRCWLMDACSPILCCSVGNIYDRLA